MPNQDKQTFGDALREARQRRNLSQKEVAARLPSYYRTVGNYGRAEQGTRIPDRDRVLAILLQGVRIRDINEINALLDLAGHGPLREEELMELDLVAETEHVEPPPPSSTYEWIQWAVVLVVSVAIAVALSWTRSAHATFILITSVLNATLFAISILLETVFASEGSQRTSAAMKVFALILLSSVGGMVLDEALVFANSPLALPFTGAIFLVTTAAQFLVARSTLPSVPVVPASFQTMTAQTAHLKNSCYFMLLNVLFWLPSFHTALTLTRELQADQRAWVQEMLGKDLLVGRGAFALSVRVQLGLLFVIMALSLYMGARLLDHLIPHEKLNLFTQLFYLRAVAYFVLCLICIGWYAYTLSGLT